MRSLALISTLLLASWINQNLIAQAHLSWKYARLTAGMDTVGRLSDSSKLSRTLYAIAYGSTGKHFPNQMRAKIDSARIDQVVGRILKDTSQWKLFAEPVKLANFLMGKEWLSDAFTEGRYNNLSSKSYPAPHIGPVVITYTLVKADAGLVYYQDTYKALANKPITFTR